MTVKELEQRVTALEEQVRQLRGTRASPKGDGGHDWEATVDKFKNDEHILAVLADAMTLREKERRAVRRKRTKSRRTTSP